MHTPQLSAERQAMLDVLTEYHRERFQHFERELAEDQRGRDRKGRFSLARAIEQMATIGASGGDERFGRVALGSALSGVEAEYFSETQRLAGGLPSAGVILPWSFFRRPTAQWPDLVAGDQRAMQTRDLTVASTPGGGYLVGTENLEAHDLLAPWSATLRSGVTLVTGLRDSVAVPRVTGDPVITWQVSEGTAVSPSQPTLAQVAVTPKSARAIVNVSRLLRLQSDIDNVLARVLLRCAGYVIDRAVLDGSGAAGQPLGIMRTPGISTQSGTSLAWSGVLAMKGNAAAINAQDGRIGFVGTPAVRTLLEGREKATGNGGFIWQDDRIASCGANATTNMPTASLLAGPFAEAFYLSWGPGITLEVNPYDSTLFKQGVIQIAVVMTCDVVVACAPSGFTKSESIT